MNAWFRSWHGAPTDAKWRTVARRAGVRPGDVAAVVWLLLDRASQAKERGSVAGYDPEVIADALGYEPEEVIAIIAGLRDKAVLDEKDMFVGWHKHQPEREDGAAERARAWRERNRTQPNAAERNRTPDTDETREDKIDKSPAQQLEPGVRGCAALSDLELVLRQAAGLVGSDAAWVKATGPIALLVEAGFSLENEIIPYIRSKTAAGIAASSWSYFVKGIREQRTVAAGAVVKLRPDPAAVEKPKPGPTPDGRFYLRQYTPQFDAWNDHLRATGGVGSPTDKFGGWTFASEWPPGRSPPQRSQAEFDAIPGRLKVGAR